MTDSPGRTAPSFLAATIRVARTELTASLRDRQTTLYTLVLPIVLYPFVFWCMIQASLFVEGKREHTEVRVGIAAAGEDLEPAGLAEALAKPRDAAAPDLDRVSVLGTREPAGKEEARAWLSARAGSQPRPDAVVYLGRGADGGRAGVDVLYNSSSTGSEIALSRVQKRIPELVRDLRARSAEEAGKPAATLEPFRRDAVRNVAPQQAVGAYILSFILPLLFVIMSVMGAFFPAVDTTCGERERRTAETTLLLPVPRDAVHLGKILAVCVAAILATSLNLIALALSAEHLLRMLPASGGVQVDVPVRALLQVAPLLLLFAFFVSSILTGTAALARTFKEGQALLGPVQILFVVPAMAGVLPGLELTPALAGVPVINVVLCFRGLLRGDDVAIPYAITALSLALLSVVAIWVSIWTLSRESMLVSEQGTAWSHFVGLWRSPRGAR